MNVSADRKSITTLYGFAVLGLCTAIIYLFRIETERFFDMLVVASCGFVVRSVAPARYRHQVFLLTSLAAGYVTVGARTTACVAFLATAFVVISRLPLRPLWRGLATIALLATPFVLRHAARSTLLPWSLGTTDWAVIGSVFGFRALMFHYDASVAGVKTSSAQQLSYFVLLPNFAVTLFPIVDHQTFVTSYVAESTRDDYARGGRMMLAGVGHLLAYRLAYTYVVRDADDVVGFVDRASFVVGLYLLYLRVSGLFHVVIGVLYFFGYRLPKTHDAHLLAQGFGDFWRRANIYWRDFNQKFVFSPLAARLSRHRGGMQLAVFITLVVSWAIHSYQFFTIFGAPLVEWRDFVFWIVLAVAMVVSATLQERKPKKRRLGAKPEPKRLADVLRSGVRTSLFFVAIALLWSFWTADSWKSWAKVVGGGS